MKTIRLLWITAILTLSGNALLAQGAGCNNPIVVTSTEPFFEGFEGGVIPDCWTQPDSSWWTVGTGDEDFVQGTFEGNGNARIFHHVTGAITRLVTPLLDLSMLPTAQLVFCQLRREYGGDIDGLRILYRTSDTGSWQSLALYTSNTDTWVETTVMLPNTSGNYQVAFEYIDCWGYGCGLDNIYIGAPRSCFRVQALDTLAVTSNSITLVWHDTLNTGATYTVSWWDDAGDTLSTVVADTTLTVTGLGGSTMYHFAVTANCTDGTGSYPLCRSFRTAAGVAHVPFCERFFNYHSLEGWTLLHGFANVAGVAYMDMDRMMSIDGAIALPPMDRPTGMLQVRFWVLPGTPYNEVERGTVNVGYMTNLSDSSTFVSLASWTNVECFQYDERAVPMTGAPDNAHIVLRCEFDNGYSHWLVDNVVVELIPDCLRPQSVTVGDVTDNSIEISIIGYDDNYRVRWTDGITADSVDISDTAYTITGLADNTQYIISVATRCQNGSVTHPVSIRARTKCLTFTVPYIDDFETYPYEIPPYCWTLLSGGVSIDYRADMWGYSTQLLFFRGTTVNAIALPVFDMATDSLQVRFFLRPSTYRSASLGVFSVGYMTDITDTGTFVELDSWSGVEWNQLTTLEKAVPMIGAPAGARIVLWHNAVSSNQGWSLDSLVVEPMPPCPPPSRLIVDSVGLDMVSVHFRGGRTGNYRLYITDGSAYSDSVVLMAANSYTFTGLNQATTYIISLVADCGSEVSDQITTHASTQMLADTLPYYTGFELGEDTLWRLLFSNTDNQWYIGSAVSSSGRKSLYITDDGGISNHFYPGTQSSPYFSNSYAYKTFWVDAPAEYQISYDWHSRGRLRILLTPASFEVNTDYNFVSQGNPAGSIVLDNGGFMNQSDTMQHFSRIVTVDTPGYYHLLIYWSSGGGTQPPAAIDNIDLHRVSCPAVRNLVVDSVAQGAVNLSWTPFGSENEWAVTVDDRTVIVSSPTYFCTGLAPVTSYTMSVRPVCGVGDTGLAVSGWFTTGLCDGATVMKNFDSTYSTSINMETLFGVITSGYSYAQTIIPASLMDVDGSEIRAFSFNVRSGTVNMPGVDVFLANVPDSTLEAGFIHPDSNHQFVLVIDNGDLSFSGSGLYTHSFDTNFIWDGHSNVLFAVRRNQRLKNQGAQFFGHRCLSKRFRDVYSSDAPFDINNVSDGWAVQWFSDIYLISCPEGCESPAVTDIVADNESVTIWFDAYDTVEAYITTAEWDDNVHGDLVDTSADHYTFTGLTPMQHYNVGVRQVCNDSSFSPWVVYSVTTLDMGCLPPSDFTLGDADYVSQPFSWTPAAGEMAWQIHVFNAFTNTTYNTTAIPATVGGLRPGTTYQASIRSLCGLVGDIPGPWGDTLTFTTVDCPSVTGMSVSNVSATEATVSWQPVAGSAGYRIYYGFAGFYDAEAAIVDVDAATTSYTITGLDGSTDYEVYVLNICTPTVFSGVSEGQRVSFTTAVGINNSTLNTQHSTLIYPNPTNGRVTLTTSGFEGSVQIEIVDLNGRVRGEWRVESGECRVDVSGLTPGAYFVKVTGVNMTAVEKLMVR